ASSSPRPWRLSGFRFFWLGQSLGVFGGQISEFTIPSVAILVLRADPVAVGGLRAVQLLPYLIFGLLIGALSDRTSRRRLILAAAMGRALVLASIPVAAALHGLSLSLLYLVAVVHGTLSVVFNVTCQAYLPELVERPQLADANVSLQFSRSAIEIGSPAVSGLMIQWLGAANAVVADALSHLSAVLAISRLPASPASRTASAGRWWSLGRQIREGLALVLREPTIRAVTATSTSLNFGYSMAQAVLLLFAYRELRLSPAVVGSLLALGSLGFVLGAAMASPLSRRFGLERMLGASGLMIGVGLLVLPLAGLGPAGPLLVTSQFLVSMQFPMYNANQITLRQQRTPIQLQGRVNATVRTVGMGFVPVASALAGLLGVRLGLAPTIAIGGLIAIVSPLWLLGSRRPGR
ncbi:MAG TPA: MFS transporter, partial [Candidatus Eisenbacteria bacterium]|nr:MFS transporter [Candidatus Eisenbacteria bacterium]